MIAFSYIIYVWSLSPYIQMVQLNWICFSVGICALSRKAFLPCNIVRIRFKWNIQPASFQKWIRICLAPGEIYLQFDQWLKPRLNVRKTSSIEALRTSWSRQNADRQHHRSPAGIFINESPELIDQHLPSSFSLNELLQAISTTLFETRHFKMLIYPATKIFFFLQNHIRPIIV